MTVDPLIHQLFDPTFVSHNRLTMTNPHVRQSLPSTLSLNGTWDFSLVDGPGSAPAGWQTADPSTLAFDTIEVQVSGLGKAPAIFRTTPTFRCHGMSSRRTCRFTTPLASTEPRFLLTRRPGQS